MGSVAYPEFRLDKYVGGSEKNIARIFQQADHDNCILFFDEVDSLLLDRPGLSQSHEIQQVNELLTHMECFNQPFFAATNFAERLDKAVMRRFDYKLSFDFLKQEQVQVHLLYKQTTKSKTLTKAITSQLNPLKILTPGDFSILARRQKITANKLLGHECIGVLKSENKRKSTSNSIGFI
ncbi:ATP-binding protein [Psychromonas sp. Urea-02u-13]|uniref:ATP-binding protein n=1 Tax=Psychromonas sp. Urea-02u-13 TaxID=2058326 RepID=UPI001E430B71|nr:ATP-binding protein [Psychromonas sp. Urea-02u-13]